MNPKKFFGSLLGAYVAFCMLLVAPVGAQGPLDARTRYLNGEGVIGGFSAVSTDVAMLIQYTGSDPGGGTVTVAAGGDLTLSIGAVGASAVDTTVECDSSIAATGSRSGIFDLSSPHANCDTYGEIVDLINNQGTGWLAVLVGARRSDSTDNTLITLSEAAANTVNGVGLLADGVTTFATNKVIAPAAAAYMPFYKAGGPNRTVRTLKANPFLGLTPVFFTLTGTSTYGSGSSAFRLSCIAVTNSLTTGSETVSSYSIAAGASTVAASWTPNTAYGVACPQGQKMVASTVNTLAMSASVLYVAGHVY